MNFFRTSFIILLLGPGAYALNSVFSVNSHFADRAVSTTVSLQPTFKDALKNIDIDLSLDANRNRNQVNYNSSVDDFTIEKNTFSGGLAVTWNHMLSLGIEGSTGNVNQDQARTNEVAGKIRIHVQDFSVSAAISNTTIKQRQDFYIIFSDYKDQMSVRNTRQTYSASYYGFDFLTLSLNYSKYKYDSDIASLNTLLSARTVLLRNGAAFLSQIYSLIDDEVNLDIVYNLSEILDLEMTFGESFDFLDPYTKSNNFRLGSTIYFNVVSLGCGVTVVKPSDSGDSFYSGDLTLSYEF